MPLVGPSDLDAVRQRFLHYLAELRVWNVRGNLVAASDAPRLIRRHVVESLAAVPLIDQLGGEIILDLGSGGGFPGIPVKLVRPALRVLLVESRRMKSLFLERVVRELGLEDAVVWQVRAEALAALPGPALPGGESPTLPPRGPERPASRPLVDLVTSRAVARLEQVADWAAPLMRPGGHLVLFKGSRLDAEIEAWRARPGPWEIAELRRDVMPNLSLVALRHRPES